MKNMHYLFRLSLLLFVFSLQSCGQAPLPKETRLLNSIEAIKNAAEIRSLSQMMDYISPDYSDANKRSYTDVKRMLQIQILRKKKIYILTDIKNIEWKSEDIAEVEISTALAGQPIDNTSVLDSIRADLISFTVQMQQEDDRFIVTNAVWTRAGLTDFL